MDVPLSHTGHSQARDVAGRLISLFPHSTPGIFSSDLQRARQTAQPLMEALSLRGTVPEPVLLQELREINLGQWQGKTRDQLRQEREPDGTSLFERWLADPRNVIPRGGESMAQFSRRAWAGMNKVINDSAGLCGAVVFTHGGVISMILNRIFGRGLGNLVRYNFPNTGIAILQHRNNKLYYVDGDASK